MVVVVGISFNLIIIRVDQGKTMDNAQGTKAAGTTESMGFRRGTYITNELTTTDAEIAMPWPHDSSFTADEKSAQSAKFENEILPR